MSLQEYLKKHKLSCKIEDAVNAAIRVKTPNPVLHISNHMIKAISSFITKLKAQQIIDSRGNPTVEVDLYINKGMFRAAVPSDASAGVYEAVELRDDDQNLSGNANFVLPVPAFNIINGGKYAGNKLAFQEFMILPIGASIFSEAMQMGSETYHHLKSIIRERYGIDACNVGDEGGFAPNVSSSKKGLELIIEKAGYSGKIKVGRDVAASELRKDNKYDLDFKNPNKSGENIKIGEEIIEMYKELCSEFPV